MNLIPTVLEKEKNQDRVYDLYSRLLKDRIIILSKEIDDDTANIVVAELLYLDSLNHEDISIYINSNGGSITSGMAIYDTMNYIRSDVSTICIGMAASMAAVQARRVHLLQSVRRPHRHAVQLRRQAAAHRRLAAVPLPHVVRRLSTGAPLPAVHLR